MNKCFKSRWSFLYCFVIACVFMLFSLSLYASPDVEYLGSIKGHKGAINSLQFGNDNLTLLSASSDGTARTWDIGDGQLIRRLTKGRTPMYQAIFSYDGNYVLTTGERKTVRLYELENGRQKQLFTGALADQKCVAISPDGNYIVAGGTDNNITVWTIEDKQPVNVFVGHSAPITAIAFSPDGEILASVSLDGKLNIWQLQTGYLESSYNMKMPLHAVVFSPCGQKIAFAGENIVKVFDFANKKEFMTLKGHEGIVNDLCYSPNGKYIVTGSNDKTTKIWSTTTGRELETLSQQDGIISAVAFSPDGKTVATASTKYKGEEGKSFQGDQYISLWDASELYSDNRITAMIEKALYHWQKKGEFEKQSSYQTRIKGIDRQAGMLFTRVFQQHASDISEEAVLSVYDPEKEAFNIQLPSVGEFSLRVPIEKAANFKKNFHKVIFRNFAVIPRVQVPYKSTWELKGLEVYLPPTQESYYYGELDKGKLPYKGSKY